MPALVRALGLAFGLIAAGCGERTLELSQVVVVVGGDARIDTLFISVQSENGRNESDAQRITLSARADGSRLPTSFSLIPPDAELDEERRFRLVVTGEHYAQGLGQPLIQSTVIASFTPGKTTLLPIVLSPACAGETCGCSAAQASCPETCLPPGIEREQAACMLVPRYARLAEVKPGRELQALREGAGGCQPGELLEPGGYCNDLDECAFGLDDCDHEPYACVNEVTGAQRYRCVCPGGYSGDGVGPDGCR